MGLFVGADSLYVIGDVGLTRYATPTGRQGRRPALLIRAFEYRRRTRCPRLAPRPDAGSIFSAGKKTKNPSTAINRSFAQSHVPIQEPIAAAWALPRRHL